jgi:hypothetical protein
MKKVNGRLEVPSVEISSSACETSSARVSKPAVPCLQIALVRQLSPNGEGAPRDVVPDIISATCSITPGQLSDILEMMYAMVDLNSYNLHYHNFDLKESPD